jgi:Protein of unknown function (DUF4246)
MRTLLEVKLDRLTHSIRTKPQWWHKVNDETILSKWRAEAAALDVSEELFRFAVQVWSCFSLRMHHDAICSFYRDIHVRGLLASGLFICVNGEALAVPPKLRMRRCIRPNLHSLWSDALQAVQQCNRRHIAAQ